MKCSGCDTEFIYENINKHVNARGKNITLVVCPYCGSIFKDPIELKSTNENLKESIEYKKLHD